MDPRAAYKSQPEVAVTCDFGIQNPSTWIPETTVVKSVNVLYLGGFNNYPKQGLFQSKQGSFKDSGSSYLKKWVVKHGKLPKKV